MGNKKRRVWAYSGKISNLNDENFIFLINKFNFYFEKFFFEK
jgi:hypothetical protein